MKLLFIAFLPLLLNGALTFQSKQIQPPADESYDFMQDYPSVKIGDQTWMTINWNYPTPKSFFYNDDSTVNPRYGKLYYYSNAMAANPPGWHLPTLDEWWKLIDQLGGTVSAGQKLMEDDTTGVGLDLIYGGYKSANISPDDLFGFIDTQAFYWSSTPDGDQTAYAIHIRKNSHEIEINSFRRANGFSVRYIKNN